MIVDNDKKEIPESTKDILKLVKSLVSKQKLPEKVKEWAEDFENLIVDINSSK